MSGKVLLLFRGAIHIYSLMLDYEWGNPSTIILAGNEGGTTGKPDQTRRQIFDHNFTMLSNNNILQGVSHQYHHHFNPPQPHQHHAFFDPRAFQSAFTTSFSPPPRSMLSLNSIPPLATPHCGLGFLLMHKPDDVMNFEGSAHRLGHGPGLGLNLGGRTYFDPFNDNTVNRLYRTKTVESVTTLSSNLPRCQAEGCNADLSDAKHYHRRHKVCEYHSKAATVVAAGLTQRFCQQYSTFFQNLTMGNGAAGRDWQIIIVAEEKLSRLLKKFTNLSILWTMLQGPYLNLELNLRRRRGRWQYVSPPDYFQQQRPNQNRGSSSSTTSISGSLFFSGG
ncbi:hypothetical protein JHK87_000835 [Glycine soja]|nr:hypothetical protein JHK87_000835 [Glycine soja]